MPFRVRSLCQAESGTGTGEQVSEVGRVRGAISTTDRVVGAAEHFAELGDLHLSDDLVGDPLWAEKMAVVGLDLALGCSKARIPEESGRLAVAMVERVELREREQQCSLASTRACRRVARAAHRYRACRGYSPCR